MPERRYSDEEVHRILAEAVEVDATLDTGAGRGLTLAEIQSVAAEAGVSPASVSAAVAALDHAPRVQVVPRVFGLPVGVTRTVVLPGAIDDAGWQRLVAYLQNTFEARGREDQGAGRRQWRNGNLRISVETVGGTTLLHLRTRKESARSLIRGGGGFAFAGLVLEATNAIAHVGAGAFAGAVALALAGVGMAAAGALQLPGWSGARGRQFDAVADYARQLSGGE
jgi:hypothetical protein